MANPIANPGVMGGYFDPARGVAEGESGEPQPAGAGIGIASGGNTRPPAILFVSGSFSFCLKASSRLISSSMRLAKR